METDERVEKVEVEREVRGIVISSGVRREPGPRIAAFIWGGKVRPVPTLPYGRWKIVAG